MTAVRLQAVLDFARRPLNNPPMPGLSLDGVTKHFCDAGGQVVHAVSNLSLDVGENEFLCLVGPSGCGKTTTLRLIAGLESPDAGRVLLHGQTVNHVPPRDRDVAMLFQSNALFPHMTAAENIGLGLGLRGVSRTEIHRRVEEVGGLLEISGLLRRRPAELSGGERQRVALGRALIRRPRLLLLDEPFSQLDALLRGRLRTEILRLHRAMKLSTLCVTHDLAEAMSLADRIAIMRAGCIEQIGRPVEIRERPANDFVREFLGSIPMFTREK